MAENDIHVTETGPRAHEYNTKQLARFHHDAFTDPMGRFVSHTPYTLHISDEFFTVQDSGTAINFVWFLTFFPTT